MASKRKKPTCIGFVFFIRWSAAQGAGMRHPREMGVKDVETFLSMMANERKGIGVRLQLNRVAINNMAILAHIY